MKKKAQGHVEAAYLDWALQDFSGYIAADELYDGPFCVLSLVDNRTCKRVFYQVLERDQAPTQALVAAFFGQFQAVLVARGLSLAGITTDGSELYPPAIKAVFGDVPHQLCVFHVLKNITQAVLHAVAKVRKHLSAGKPKLKRGRPSQERHAQRQARQARRLQQKVADLFTHRYLFVQRHLTAAERKTLQSITRGLPQLRTLRAIMELVYRLFDRRCGTATALAKLANLRKRVQRFQQVGKTLQCLFSPHLEKALVFLDDRLLPATSNAVERGNRRHRKMQKTVYRVRTQARIAGRIALDMQREEQAPKRRGTTASLHRTRAKQPRRNAPAPAVQPTPVVVL